MLNLTQQQLKFLIIVDMEDNWHPSYFLERVVVHYANSEQKPFNEVELENMMAELKKLSTDRIANLQFALCAFGNI